MVLLKKLVLLSAIFVSGEFVVMRLPVAGFNCMTKMPSEYQPKDIHMVPLVSTRILGSMQL